MLKFNFSLYEVELYHRLLWTPLAETGAQLKNSVSFEAHGFDLGYIDSHCFACQWVKEQRSKGGPQPLGENESFCHICPIQWPVPRGCMGPSSPYTQWSRPDFTDYQRKYYAAKIRDIKFKHEL